MNCPSCTSSQTTSKPCRIPHMMTCTACGFVFATPIKDPAAADLYEEDWAKAEGVFPTYVYAHGKFRPRHEWKMLQLLDRLGPFQKNNRMLDIGCSVPMFLKVARDKRGWDVQGVEVSDFAVKLSREQLQIPVFQGLLQDAGFADDSFDVVFSSHTIEHVEQPLQFVRDIKRVLRPGGALVTILPTQFTAPSYVFFRKWTGEVPPRHVSYFSKRTFEAMLQRAGFSVIYSRQNVELRKFLRGSEDDPGTPSADIAAAMTHDAEDPPPSFPVRLVKEFVNTIGTFVGLGNELTTIARNVKP
jgi:SAM-dependent methyltransferase